LRKRPTRVPRRRRGISRQDGLRFVFRAILAQAAEDVFDVDDGVVHNFTDRDGQAASVMVLIVPPKRRRTMIATTSDSGIAIKLMTPARQLNRNSNRTTMTRIPP